MVIKSQIVWQRVNALSHNKLLNSSKLKAFADDKRNVTEKLKSVLERKIVGKGENAGYQHFLLFPQCFSTGFLDRSSSWLENSQPLSKTSRFLRVCSTSLLKMLWEKDKMLVRINLSFSNSVFYPFGEYSTIFNRFENVVCKLSVWKSLKFVV